ncbi:MAG: hypothetical protein GX130_01735 [Candidatus Hydrogenedens sp.]|nr:hypothetical protein [Candidatus Hydrogenedens sp.]
MNPNDSHNRINDRTDDLIQPENQDGRGVSADQWNLEHELIALGEELISIMPSVRLEQAVMDRLATSGADEETLEDELFLLGDALSASAPEADLLGGIMEQVYIQEHREQQEMKTELVALGREMRDKQPETDIVEPVIARLSSQKDGTIHPFSGSPSRRRESWASAQLWLTLAACLLLGFGILFAQLIRPALSQWTVPSVRTVLEQSPQESTSDQKKEASEGEVMTLKMASGEGSVVLSSLNRPTPYEEEQGEEVLKNKKEEHSLAEILKLRQNAMDGKSDALALLARWGALDPDQARKLMAEGSLSPSELAALSRFLPRDEAIALLRDAIKMQDQDPALRLALAKMIGDDPQYQEEALAMHVALRGLDPDNSLFQFMEAHLYFSTGDYASGIEALQEAGRFSSASAYSLANAQNHRAVLEAAGYPDDAAAALAASYAGTEEYAYLQQMRDDLLDYGNYFESIGDFETAFAIYKSIGELGSQLISSATFANEQLAGLDMQMAAVDALGTLIQILNIPGATQIMENTYTLFVESLDLFLENMNYLDEYLRQGNTHSIMDAINEVLQNGEISWLQSRSNE